MKSLSPPHEYAQRRRPVTREVSEELIVVELSRTLLRRRTLILACTLACVTTAFLYAIVKRPQYEASAQIEVSPTGTNSLGLNELASKALGPTDPAIQLQSAVQILKSNAIAMEAMEQLRMPSRRDFAGRWVQPPRHTIEEANAEARDQLLERFRQSLRVEIVPKTDIISVRFRAKDALLAADVVNAVVNSYTERNFRTSYNSAMQVSEWLSKQMDDLRSRVEESQQRLAKLQQKTGLIGVDESDNIVTDKLKQLDEQLTAAQSDRIVKEARYRIAGSENPELIATTVPNPTLQVLRSQQAELRVQYAQLSTKFGAGYPKLAELSNQMLQVEDAITAELKNLAERYRNEYRAAANTEQMLRAKFDEQKQKAYDLNSSAAEYGILKHEVESTQDLYETLQLKLKQAGIVAGLASANVGVVDRAQVPSQPVQPQLWYDMLIGLGCGVSLGMVSAISLEALDNSVRTSEELEVISSFPTLATIPFCKPVPQANAERYQTGDRVPLNLATCEPPPSTVSESFRSLRSSLFLGSSGRALKTIVIASSVGEEGKTFTATNLAVVVAQQGARVLLVDADFRHSSIHTTFEIPNQPGLSAVLAMKCDSHTATVAAKSLPNLSLLPAGSQSLYPAEGLASDAMRKLLISWRSEYDLIVIDTPPVCLFTDAVILSSWADAVLLVVRSSRTTKHAVLRARDLLMRADATIAGLVLNATDQRYEASYYFNRYGYLGDKTSAIHLGSTL